MSVWQLQPAQCLFSGDESPPLLSQPHGAGTFTAQKTLFLDGAGGRGMITALGRALSRD